MRIVIVGGGFCGSVLANRLKEKADILILEKSRGLGGKLSTRYAPPFTFDHGCPFFEARSREFQNFLEPLIRTGWVAPFDARIQTETQAVIQKSFFTGTPHMNSLCQALVEGLDTRFQTKVTGIRREKSGLWLDLETSEPIQADKIILTMPHPQAQALLGLTSPLVYHSTFVLMIGCAEYMKLDWDIFYPVQTRIQKIVHNSAKPGRDREKSAFVAYMQPQMSSELPKEQDLLQTELLQEFCRILPKANNKIEFVSMHRWLYLEPGATLDAEIEEHLVLCGDYCFGPSVEEIWTGANDLAGRIA